MNGGNVKNLPLIFPIQIELFQWNKSRSINRPVLTGQCNTTFTPIP